MSSSVLRLEETSSALREALAKQNWVAIGELDLQCRLAVDAAMIDGGNDAQLRSSLERLLMLYRDLVSVCQAEQRRMACELVLINQSREAAKVYQLFG